MRLVWIVAAVGALGACSKKAQDAAPAAGSATATAGSGSAAATPPGPPGPGQPGHGSALVGVVSGGSDLPPCVPAAGVALPKTFPQGMPVPAEARALSSQPWAQGTLVRFAYKANLNDAAAYFTKSLGEEGFVVGKSAHDRENAELAYTKAPIHGMVAMRELAGCAGVLEVQIAYANDAAAPAKK